MHHYKALVRGDDIGRLIDGVEHAMGFYVTVFVQAQDETVACATALTEVRNRLMRSGTMGAISQLRAEEIELVDKGDVPEVSPGFVWFPGD